jgi:phytoene desaturase
MNRVVVIGAGIGGLAASARLAKAGYEVKVFEKLNQPGGRTGRLEAGGYTFDTGPTLFLMPDVFASTYADLGERMQDHLDLVRLDPTYRVHFRDGTQLDLTSDLRWMREQLESIEPGSFMKFLQFMAEGYRHYHLSLERFVGRNFYSLAGYFSPTNLPLLFQVKALVKHANNTRRYFKDPRLLAAFSFQNMYLGLSPYEAPATYSLLQYSELADGVWFPRGGLYKVITSLESIARNYGVDICYGTPVAGIQARDGFVRGVVLESGDKIPADLVLSNADLPYVIHQLLPPDGYHRRLERMKYTSSAFMFYWGVKGDRSPLLLHHNVFLADHRYRVSFDRIFHDLTLPDEPSFYVCAATRTEPAFAPLGGDSLMALVPVGHINEEHPQDWDLLTEKARTSVIDALEAIGVNNLHQRIVYEAKWGPPQYRDALNLEKGAAFGLSHQFTQVGYLRPRNRHPRYSNLYFVGASTHPGTGLPIVLMSARLVVERIERDFPLAG